LERLWKYARVRGPKGSARVIALIDTGTPHSILPREVALTVGTMPTGKTGTLRIKGKSLRVAKYRADIEIASGGCRADVEVLVPETDTETTAIIGSLFLQQTGATIVYRDGHPVFCTDGPFTEESWAAEFVPDPFSRARARRRRASATGRSLRSRLLTCHRSP
jgi:predicted aspartyl protease